jgi:hypothetical protein
VASPQADRTGALAIRAWTEGEPKSLRVRITRTLDVSRRESESTAAASIDDVCAVVRRWLEEYVAVTDS